MFTTWRPKTAGGKDFSFPSDFRDSQSFYAAATSGLNQIFFLIKWKKTNICKNFLGVLFYVSENGRCQEVFDLGCVCRDMLYRSDKDQLLVLTESLAVVQFAISPEGALDEIMKVNIFVAFGKKLNVQVDKKLGRYLEY